MRLEDLIQHDPHTTSRGAVFVGTSVPIELLFEFLQDDQTMDTFLDQFPMVSRDQALAVLDRERPSETDRETCPWSDRLAETQKATRSELTFPQKPRRGWSCAGRVGSSPQASFNS